MADSAQLRRDVEIGADADSRMPGIGEVRLALLLRGAQRWQHAVADGERDAAAADQRHRLADPVARVGARELRVLEDRVEAGRLVVEGIACRRWRRAASAAHADPVEIARDFGARRSTALMSALRSTNMPRSVLAERVVQRGRQVPAAEVAVAVVAEIGHVVVVRRCSRRTMAGRSRKPFVVEVDCSSPSRLRL